MGNWPKQALPKRGTPSGQAPISKEVFSIVSVKCKIKINYGSVSFLSLPEWSTSIIVLFKCVITLLLFSPLDLLIIKKSSILNVVSHPVKKLIKCSPSSGQTTWWLYISLRSKPPQISSSATDSSISSLLSHSFCCSLCSHHYPFPLVEMLLPKISA